MGKVIGERVGALEVHECPDVGLTADNTTLVVSAGVFACWQSRHGHVVAAYADKVESGESDVRTNSKAFSDEASLNHASMLANSAPA
ncbi:hypothetical protein ACF06L_15175 [Streptomyces sp. NPDC015408]|uniref:hypothetical protein n=1 Tax=Streptomyces sp. NPDC015408 TaxID=3364956 RepID=UPI003700A75B